MLPGAALLRVLRAAPGSFLEGVLYSFGLSILLLMVSGLAANQILYGLGDPRPLALPGVWGAWNVMSLVCVVAGVFTNHQILQARLSRPRVSKTTCLLIVSSLLLPLLAAGGAFRLNNGGDMMVAGIAIVSAAGVMTYAFLFRNRLSDGALGWSIFMMSLAILLMTSLRSWDITGHDILHEFRVYTLTHLSGRWDIAALRDPYNACLSITILPEVYAKILHISGQVAFKLILQVIFSVTPVVIYLMLRRHVSKLGALVGCGLFISYPTFINDSAVLTRQGVAYLFFSLALLAAMRTDPKKVHKSLFLLCGFGVVLSHYSTSYMFVAIFAVAWGCKLLIQRRLQMPGDKFSVLSPGVLLLLMFATFLWYGQITATTNGLITTLRGSVTNIPHLLSDDNKSSDTSAALLLAARKSQIDVYQSYLARPELSNDIVDSPQYMPEITNDDMPVTALGKRVAALGIEPSVTTALRQQFAKILQLLTALSVCYATYVFLRQKSFTLAIDLLCFSLAGIVLLACMVALPTVSLNYGVLRAFQQSLIFLVIPLIILLTLWGRVLRPWLRTAVAAASIVALFFLFAGLPAQMLGGVSAPLTLNNYGLYYGSYYTTAADLRAYAWMKAQIPASSDVRSAMPTKAIMHDPDYPFRSLGILPTQRLASSYVYLGHAQLVAQKLYVYHEGSPLIMTFPVNYYNDQTNQIYSTTTTGVFH